MEVKCIARQKGNMKLKNLKWDTEKKLKMGKSEIGRWKENVRNQKDEIGNGEIGRKTGDAGRGNEYIDNGGEF